MFTEYTGPIWTISKKEPQHTSLWRSKKELLQNVNKAINVMIGKSLLVKADYKMRIIM